MRGATLRDQVAIHRYEFLLTRPMRGATGLTSLEGVDFPISTHTPHAGRDRFVYCVFIIFLISTHTPHAGRDYVSQQLSTDLAHFYSHAPCGARHPCLFIYKQNGKFLLTRLLRGATCVAWQNLFIIKFLLTRLLRGATHGYDTAPLEFRISTHTPLARRDLHRQ